MVEFLYYWLLYNTLLRAIYTVTIVIGKHCVGCVLAAIDYLLNAVDGNLSQEWIESVHYAMKLKTNIMSCYYAQDILHVERSILKNIILLNLV